MTAAQLVDEFVYRHPGQLVTPAIVQAYAKKRHATTWSESAIAGVLRRQLMPHARGQFVAAPKPKPWPQGKLF